MGNFNHLLKPKTDGVKPVQKWYQSHGSAPWDTPSTRSTGGFYSGRYLLRETPERVCNWSSKRKGISPEAKEMLARKVMENEAYNESRL